MTAEFSSDQGARVTLTQVASLAGVGPSAVSNWRRRFNDFPEPIGTGPEGNDMFLLAAVVSWLKDHGRGVEAARSESVYLEAANLLRSEGPADRVVEWLCAAVSLVNAAKDLGVSDVSRPADRFSAVDVIDLVEIAAPRLAGLFAPLRALPVDQASRLLVLLRSLDIAGLQDVFDRALAQRGRFAETRSHEALGRLLAVLGGQQPPALIFDPAVGEGGFLLEASRRLPRAQAFCGQDVNPAVCRIARQRLLLSRVSADIRFGDSLVDDAFPDLRADLVLCDPPYNAAPRWRDNMWSDPRWAFGIPSPRTTDYAWIQHVIHHLTREGRGYVLLPAATLYRRGPEADVRRELVGRGAVEAIVAMPAGTAMHTSVPLALWIVRRPPATETPPPVLLVDASTGGSPKGGGLEPDVAQAIAEVLAEWRGSARTSPQAPMPARGVPVFELLASDANLVPSRWASASRPGDAVGWLDRLASIAERLESARAEVARQRLDVEGMAAAVSPAAWTPIRKLLAADVAEVLRGARVRPDDCQAAGTRVLRTHDVRVGIQRTDDPCFVDQDSLRPRPTLTQPGDIIVSPGGGKPIAVVDTVGGYIIASPLQALRLKGDAVDRSVVAAFLSSPRNRRFVAGTTSGYARVDLAELEIPMLALDEAAKLGAALGDVERLSSLAAELADRASEARDALLSAVGDVGSARGLTQEEGGRPNQASRVDGGPNGPEGDG